MSSRLLSLDASSTSIGWVLWWDDEAQRWGTVFLNKGKARDDLGLRLQAAALQLSLWIEQLHPSHIAVEGAAFHSQPMALLAQSEVRGVLRYLALNAGISLIDIPPTSAKKALTGRGNAKKEQMMAFAENMLGMQVDEHMADAVGVGLAALDVLQQRQLVALANPARPPSRRG